MSTTLRDDDPRTKHVSCLQQEAYLEIMRAAAVLEHMVTETLRPHGITHTQYNVLRILRGAGDTGLCRNDVRDRMLAQVPDATRLLDRMESMGLIRRERDPEDRRYVTARITERGRELLSELDEPVVELHRRQFGAFDEEELRSLIRRLEEARRG